MSHEPMRFLVSTVIVIVLWGLFFLFVRKAKKSAAGLAGLLGILGFLFVYFALLPLPALDNQWGPEPFMQYYLRDLLIRLLPVWFWIPGGILIVYKGMVRPLIHVRENSPAKAVFSLIIGWGIGVPLTFCYWLTH